MTSVPSKFSPPVKMPEIVRTFKTQCENAGVFVRFHCDLKKKKFFFSGEKALQKIFLRRSPCKETKKKFFADFPQGFWRFSTKF